MDSAAHERVHRRDTAVDHPIARRDVERAIADRAQGTRPDAGMLPPMPARVPDAEGLHFSPLPETEEENTAAENTAEQLFF